MSDWRDAGGIAGAGPGASRIDGVRAADCSGRRNPGARLERHARLLQQPEATAKAFTADGWLRTGDLGSLTADGRLRMVGRLKDVFRVGGENVAPAEVEEVLLAHPAVETAQVVGVPDTRLGEVACAYVTLESRSTATEKELIDWCKAALRQFPGAALPEDRRRFRGHRHDGERQGAEDASCASTRCGS